MVQQWRYINILANFSIIKKFLKQRSVFKCGFWNGKCKHSITLLDDYSFAFIFSIIQFSFQTYPILLYTLQIHIRTNFDWRKIRIYEIRKLVKHVDVYEKR